MMGARHHQLQHLLVDGLVEEVVGAERNRLQGALVILVGAGFGIAAVFNMRASLVHYYNNVEPYGLSMSSGMMFVFPFAINFLYLQYHLSKIAQWKKTGIKS